MMCLKSLASTVDLAIALIATAREMCAVETPIQRNSCRPCRARPRFHPLPIFCGCAMSSLFHASAGGFPGSHTVNRVPLPELRLDRDTSPVLLNDFGNDIDKPRPVPFPTSLVEKNGSKILGSTSGLMPSPLVRDFDSDAVAVATRGDGDHTRPGAHRLRRVGQQVQKHLVGSATARTLWAGRRRNYG